MLRYFGTFSLQTIRTNMVEDSSNQRCHLDYQIPFQFQGTAVYSLIGLITCPCPTYHLNPLLNPEPVLLTNFHVEIHVSLKTKIFKPGI